MIEDEKRRPGRPRKEAAPETRALEFTGRYAPKDILRDGKWVPNDNTVTFKFVPGDKGELPTTEAAYVVSIGRARYL